MKNRILSDNVSWRQPGIKTKTTVRGFFTSLNSWWGYATVRRYNLTHLHCHWLYIHVKDVKLFPRKLVNRCEQLSIWKKMINRAEHHHEADYSSNLILASESAKEYFLKIVFLSFFEIWDGPRLVGLVVMFSSIYQIFRYINYRKLTGQFWRKHFWTIILHTSLSSP